jgi:hypothetical protein
MNKASYALLEAEAAMKAAEVLIKVICLII